MTHTCALDPAGSDAVKEVQNPQAYIFTVSCEVSKDEGEKPAEVFAKWKEMCADVAEKDRRKQALLALTVSRTRCVKKRREPFSLLFTGVFAQKKLVQ